MTNTMPSKQPNGTITLPTPSTSPQNAWFTPGPAAFDFRSDVVTTPTPSMLAAIQNTTLLDDVFQEDPTTNALESYIADLTGHEAALLVCSGTMGNQLALRTLLTQPPHSVLADARSHVIGWEAGGLASLSQALAIPVLPKNSHHLTLSDITAHAITSTDIHACPTRVISLENTLAGTILPLRDCQQIHQWARAQDPPIATHLDGARLWEAVVAGAGAEDGAEALKRGLKEYSNCFDSMSLCFSKGLGAPLGSIIVGSSAFISRARHIRKSIGGGLRQSGIITSAARVAVDETFFGGLLRKSHERAREVARMWEGRGGRLGQPTETNMVWLDLEGAGVGKERFVEAGVGEGVRVLGGRLVVHYQIAQEALERLGKVMDRILSDSSSPAGGAGTQTNGETNGKGRRVEVDAKEVLSKGERIE